MLTVQTLIKILCPRTLESDPSVAVLEHARLFEEVNSEVETAKSKGQQVSAELHAKWRKAKQWHLMNVQTDRIEHIEDQIDEASRTGITDPEYHEALKKRRHEAILELNRLCPARRGSWETLPKGASHLSRRQRTWYDL
ncbi:hypothetical protein JCM16303_005678 [Sporobolomyces ruberrimus]